MYSKHFVYILYNLGGFYTIGKINKKIIGGKFAVWKKKDISLDPVNLYYKLNWDIPYLC